MDIPDEEISPEEIEPGADLISADLSAADLRFAELSNANLHEVDLSGESTRLFNADLSSANLEGADLSGAYLRDADLSDADLREANLAGARLSQANLSRADLRGAALQNLDLDQGTRLGKLCTAPEEPSEYVELAQQYHKLKEQFSESGLDQRARRARFLERHARTIEALKRGQTRTWLGGYLSRWLTGYGTKASLVFAWTAVILLLSTVVYVLGPTPSDGWTGGPVYYSVVTFVTSPPHPPPTGPGWSRLTEVTVLFETYVGTVLIVLLGYVLGSRDRV